MDRTAFEQTAARLRPLILRIGRDFFGSADDAEDVAQETLLQLWRYCQQLDESRNIEALAVRVAKNCCVNMKRRQHLTLVRETDGMGETNPSPHLSPHEEVEREEGLKALDEAIGQLQPRERQLFEMRQQNGLSCNPANANSSRCDSKTDSQPKKSPNRRASRKPLCRAWWQWQERKCLTK